MNRALLIALVVAGAALSTTIGFIYSGTYYIGADRAHWTFTARIFELVRDHSIERQARQIQPPNLNDQQLVLKGAGQYAAMCVQCHLAPGKSESEIRPGLCPQPPDLSQVRLDPRQAFWVVKHGIKMSGMPAWGRGHDDQTIWSIVAFVNQLPDMTPETYRDLVAKAPPDEEMGSMSNASEPEHPDAHGAKRRDSGTAAQAGEMSKRR